MWISDLIGVRDVERPVWITGLAEWLGRDIAAAVHGLSVVIPAKAGIQGHAQELAHIGVLAPQFTSNSVG